MRSRILDVAMLAAGIDLRSPKGRAVDVVMQATRLGERLRPEWWRWTTWLAAGITCRRIEAA